MTFDRLIQTLEEKAKADEASILEAAKSEAKTIKSEASGKAKQIIDEAKAEGEKLGNEQRMEISANAKLKQKRVIAEAREELIKKALQSVEPLLAEFAKTRQYDQLLEKLAKDCVKSLGKDAALSCRKEDEKKLKGMGFNISGSADIYGGAIAESSDGRIKVDNSLEALLELHREKLKTIAFNEFFAGEPLSKSVPEVRTEKAKLPKKEESKPKLSSKPQVVQKKSAKLVKKINKKRG